MQRNKKGRQGIGVVIRRFAQRCEAFGEHLERIGREGLVKVDSWEKSMQIKIDKWMAKDGK